MKRFLFSRFLSGLWDGADKDLNRAINHLLGLPEDKVREQIFDNAVHSLIACLACYATDSLFVASRWFEKVKEEEVVQVQWNQSQARRSPSQAKKPRRRFRFNGFVLFQDYQRRTWALHFESLLRFWFHSFKPEDYSFWSKKLKQVARERKKKRRRRQSQQQMIGEAGCYEQESKAGRSRAMESKNCGVLLGGFFDTSASVLAMGEVVT